MDRAEAIVAEEVEKFEGWLRSRGAIPTVVALRQRFETIRRAELDRLDFKLSALPPEARARVDEVTRLIVEKLLLHADRAAEGARRSRHGRHLLGSAHAAVRPGAPRSPEREDRGAGTPEHTTTGAGPGLKEARRGAVRATEETVRELTIVPDQNELRLGTRGSQLALWQANRVAAEIAARGGPTSRIVVIKTSGDRLQDAPLSEVGGKRLFVKEIEDALLRGEIDLAVHSSKDMPAVLPEGSPSARCCPARTRAMRSCCPIRLKAGHYGRRSVRL